MSATGHTRATEPSNGPPDVPTATLADVDIVAELATRPLRPLHEHGREDRAFAQLAAEMAENPRNMLQKLVEIAVDLCDADTSGISLLDGNVFRWEAVAGVFAAARGGTMPRDQSPCGVCIDRDATQLMHLADRCFPSLTSEPRFVEALLIPFHDHGKAIGTVWIVSHSLEKQFDKEDERIVRVLSQFASAGWQLWKTSETAAALAERKDDFLATLSHELRNPFGTIVAAAANLQQRVAHDAGSSRALDVIARQSRHVSRLLDDLIDIARIGRGKLELDRKTVDLREVVAETIDLRRTQIEQRQHSLALDLGAEPVFVDGDPMRLAQVVSNLVENAAKYTPEHGDIVVTLSTENEFAVLTVRDNGVGVPAEQTETIFEPFVQLNSSRNAIGGLGLGLALVRSVMDLHGGTVKVSSAGIAQGSCFTLRLPTCPATTA